MKASWTGWLSPSPSTVVISRPSARGASRIQVEIGSPSKSAVHAPQTPTPHVWRTLVRSSSRLRTPRSISSGRASASTACPFTVNATFKLPPQYLRRGRNSTDFAASAPPEKPDDNDRYQSHPERPEEELRRLRGSQPLGLGEDPGGFSVRAFLGPR